MCLPLGPLVFSYVLHRHTHTYANGSVWTLVSAVIGLDPLVPLVSKLRSSSLSSIWPRLMTAPKAGFQASYPPPWLSSLMLASDRTLTHSRLLQLLVL